MSTFDRLIGNVQPYLDAIEKKRQRDTGMTYGQLRQFQAVDNTDSPTNQMSPNIVAPDKQNPAVTGMPAANTAPAQEAAPQLDSYDKMLQYLDAQRKVDANADRHAKAREMFAAIGDGISALSSMYQTTKGAPVTYTQGKDMTAVVQGRNDRMLAQRKADSDKYLNYLKVQAAREAAEKSEEYQQARIKALSEGNEYKARYYESLAEKWKNQADLERQKAAEKEREFNERQKAAKEKADKDRLSRERTADKNRAAADARAAKAEAGRNARHNDSESRKDKRAEAARKNNRYNTGNRQNKTKRTSKTKV